MSAFADLHRPGAPLLLPNAWDHASAAALAAAGFAAVGTTSLGVAAALGLRDGAAETAEATIELAHRLTHLPGPDHDGHRGRLLQGPRRRSRTTSSGSAPVAGVNLEDQLGDTATHAAGDRRRQGRTPDVFVNARIDTYWLGRPSLDETLERAQAYVDAGADGIFVPGVTDEREIAALAEALPVPLNVLFAPARSPSPGSPSSASPASAPARCSTASRSAPRSTRRPPSRDGATRVRSPVLRGRSTTSPQPKDLKGPGPFRRS